MVGVKHCMSTCTQLCIENIRKAGEKWKLGLLAPAGTHTTLLTINAVFKCAQTEVKQKILPVPT